MKAEIAQIAALACHLNARCRGLTVERMFPDNSTCRGCAFVRFVQIATRSATGGLSECIETPDEWIDALVQNGIWRGFLRYAPRNFPLAADRISSAFAGEGGDWWIGVDCRRQMAWWQPFWRTGHRNPAEKRIWRVQYDETDRGPPVANPEIDVAELSEHLSEALAAIEKFASKQQLGSFAARFRKANRSLTADGEVLIADHYYKDLAPIGSLGLPSRRLLACCEDAWVFGGMG